MFVAVIVGARAIANRRAFSAVDADDKLRPCRMRAASDLLQRLPAERAQITEYIFVGDPPGNVVLSYGRDAGPRKLIKDLARLF